MITIKAFKKGLKCWNMEYSIGIEYTCDTSKVKLCKYGFHASRNCDLYDTIYIYDPISYKNELEYCLVDINVIDQDDIKVVGDKIRLLKKLEFPELLGYDRSGYWALEWLYYEKSKFRIKMLLEHIVSKEEGIYLLKKVIEHIPGLDINLLQDIVIRNDETGELCLYLATHRPDDVNFEILQDVIKKQDKKGEYYDKFLRLGFVSHGKFIEEIITGKSNLMRKFLYIF